MSEEDTKTHYINPKLRQSGWYDGKNVRMEYKDKPLYYTDGKINSFNGQRGERRGKFLDYLLYCPDIHHKIAVIEAKRYDLPEGKGMQQGLTYARDLKIPFVFTSNGHDFVFKDRLIASDDVHIPMDKFPTPKELLTKYVKEAHLGKDGLNLLKSQYYYRRGSISPRYYQVNAINQTLKAVAKGQHHIMFVMATGTGKTYTAFQIAWRLMHAKDLHHPINKVLYLVDRNILADQPMNGDFRAMKDVSVKLSRKQWKDPASLPAYKLYFGLYQQLFSHGKDQHLYKNFDQNFFDLIIIDEAHRGSANLDSNWHSILNYFAPKGSNTIVVGMTATPNERHGANLSYFGKPVYNYTLKQGINDGFLAPYSVIRVGTNIDEHGFTPYNGQKDVNGYPIKLQQYNTKDFDRTIIIPQRDMAVAKFVTDYLKKNGRNEKVIIFCMDINHARRMRYALIHFNQDLQHKYNDDYVAQITSGVDDAQAQLSRFEAPNSQYPVLVTTSDMLRTGVNAKDVKIIVLDTNINSMTEFKQIIGRGTRLDTENGKKSFVIIDFRNATRLFSDPKFDGTPDDIEDVTSTSQLKDHQQKMQSKPKSTGSDSVTHYIPEVNAKVYVNDAYVYHFDKNGHRITDDIRIYDKNNILSEFHSLKDFLKSWNSAARKSLFLKELRKHGILIPELRKQDKSLDKYDDFDVITHLAFDTPALSKHDRVNNVKKQGVIYKYHGQAREVLKALLEKFQKPGIDVGSLENIKTLQLPEFTHRFGDVVNVVLHDFGSKKNYTKAIDSIINSMYNDHPSAA
ncbi:EcoAI/FtnUII family type I restriction enzme subunit R [Acetilactobacillus jinshanensis]|uniref:DEAD/DEAH box helicase n=1 Tax=Acetilactobacillus jinshanensis TaxID=1720083 RepID=A0A4P6ZLS1_9LACO|nr:DEAD/DEAH box helicase family protein [Acetilactobacillus jinshanensis]QBP18180.1 DEAD/DEAH box helicase [Acetilactobacillus jinshanensis]URL61047.1 DEAD/DEAH box helicase family protein [uncultured bacterium]